MIKKLLFLILLITPCYAMQWETFYFDTEWSPALARTAVPDGWLVMYRNAASPSLVFVPDQKHEWRVK